MQAPRKKFQLRSMQMKLLPRAGGLECRSGTGIKKRNRNQKKQLRNASPPEEISAAPYADEITSQSWGAGMQKRNRNQRSGTGIKKNSFEMQAPRKKFQLRPMQMKLLPRAGGLECRSGTGIKEAEPESKKQLRNASPRKKFQLRSMQMKLLPRAGGLECRSGTGIKKRNRNQKKQLRNASPPEEISAAPYADEITSLSWGAGMQKRNWNKEAELE